MIPDKRNESMEMIAGKLNLTGKRVFSALLAAICMSLFYVVGTVFEQNKTIHAFNTIDLFWVALLSVILTGALLCLFAFLDWHSERAVSTIHSHPKNWLAKLFDCKYLPFISGVCLLLCWLPTMLTLYPGVFCTDQLHQARIMLNHSSMDAQHPVLHTILMDAFLMIGRSIGHINFTLFCYCLLQAVLLAAALTYMCMILLKNKAPKPLVAGVWILSAISPLNSIFVSCALKDTVFYAIFILFLSFVTDMSVNQDRLSQKFSYKAYFCALAVLLCLFRNQGVYILVFTTPFLIWAFHRRWKMMTALCIISIVGFYLIQTLIYTIFSVQQEANMREALSVPIQQISRTVALEKESLSEEEKELIYKLVPEQIFEGYVPEISDPIKSYFDTDYFKAHLGEYAKLYVKLGLRYPTIYIDSFLYGSYAYFYTDVKLPHWGTLLPYDNMGQEFQIDYSSKLPALLNTVKDNLLYASYQKIPILSTLLSPGLAINLVLIHLAYALSKKEKRLLAILFCVIGLWGTLILAPVISIRYGFGLVLATPLLISVFFIKNRDEHYRECYTLQQKE